jgi:DNA-binding transcriptional MerR regulator
MDVDIPEKLFFKIGEVAELTGIKPHVLRYWEAEFSPFRPAKSRTRQRRYRRKDIELVLRLKDLLYNQGYTIAGAKKKLRDGASVPPPESGQLSLPLGSDVERRFLEEIRHDLQVLRESLDGPR